MLLREKVSIAEATVDAAGGVIRGAVLLGLQSANDREYLEAAVIAAVDAGLYESLHVYEDHSEANPRPMRELIGVTRNARYDDEAKKVIADLVMVTTSEGGRRVIEMAGKPELARACGMSHDAEGKIEERAGKPDLVTEITDVLSVDVVTRPATTKGLFESERKPMRENMVGKRVRVKTPSGDVAGVVLRGPTYEVQVDGEEFTRVIPQEMLMMDDPDTTEPDEPDIAQPDDDESDTDESAAPKESDARIAALEARVALYESRERVERLTRALPEAARAAVRKYFRDKTPSKADVTAFVEAIQSAAKSRLSDDDMDMDVDDDDVTGFGPSRADDDVVEAGMAGILECVRARFGTPARKED